MRILRVSARPGLALLNLFCRLLRTYEQAQESCQSLEKNGDSWHLCFKDEVERDWKEYMLKASDSARSKRLREESPPSPRAVTVPTRFTRSWIEHPQAVLMDSVPGWTSATLAKPAASTTGGGRKPMRRARIGPADIRRTGAVRDL